MSARRKRIGVSLALLFAAGCSTIDGESNSPRTLIPAKELRVSPSLRIPAEGLVAAGIIYALVDPLAPNWKVQATPIGGNRYRLELVMKRFITGGEGEAPAVVRRMAEKLRQDGGFTDYQILQLTEGIESRIIAQRVAHALIELN